MRLRYEKRNSPVKPFRSDFRNELQTGGERYNKEIGMRGSDLINADWVRARIKALGKTQRDFAEALSIAPSRIVELLKGERKLTAGEAQKAANFLVVPVHEIMAAFGIDTSNKGYGRLVISGYIDATTGTTITRADLPHESLEDVDAPFPGYRGCAVRIKGNSMAPRYRDGEIVGYTKDHRPLEDMINQEVIVELVDGRILLKVLHRGTGKGLYTLVSLNPADSPILDAALNWAALIDFHLPHQG